MTGLTSDADRNSVKGRTVFAFFWGGGGGICKQIQSVCILCSGGRLSEGIAEDCIFYQECTEI